MGLFGVLPFFLVSCITFLLILIWRRDATKGNLPPGPTPLPLLGNLLQLKIWNIISSFQKLQEQYGSVFTVYMGSQPVVVLCGYETIKEALIDNAETFGGRKTFNVLDENLTKYGVAPTNGERWRQLRRFSVATLKNFGVGKSSIEERIQEEAHFLVEALRKTGGHPFDPTFHLSHAVSNVICSVIFGQRFEYEDKDFVFLLDLISKISLFIPSIWTQLSNIFPGLMRILPGPQHNISKYYKELTDFISQRTKMHQESLDPNCPRDFIDSFLVKMEEVDLQRRLGNTGLRALQLENHLYQTLTMIYLCPETYVPSVEGRVDPEVASTEKTNPASEFHQENLVATVFSLFFGGTDTTSTTIRQGLLVLLRYPEIEANIQEEIEQVIGRNRSPSYEDRNQMPYTEAVISEIQRFLDLAPVSLPHSVTREAHFRGFTIPKGTTVIPFLSSIMNSSEYFRTPKKFNPGHFLDENGAFKKVPAFLPFSAGKRVCLGEGLARMEIFIFLTTLLQNFHLKALQQREEIDISPEVESNGHVARRYQLCVVPR